MPGPVGWSVGVGGRLDQLGEPVAGYPVGDRLRPLPALLAGAVDALVVAGVAGVLLAEPVVLGAVSGACLHGRDLLSGSGGVTVVGGSAGAAGGGGHLGHRAAGAAVGQGAAGVVDGGLRGGVVGHAGGVDLGGVPGPADAGVALAAADDDRGAVDVDLVAGLVAGLRLHGGLLLGLGEDGGDLGGPALAAGVGGLRVLAVALVPDALGDHVRLPTSRCLM